MLCFGWKWEGEESIQVVSLADFDPGCPCCHRLSRPEDDQTLLLAIEPIFLEADAVVTWYGQRFDEPFLNTRRLFHGLRPLPPVPHIDGWRTAKYKLKLHSNRLVSLQEFLLLDAHKTPISPPQWQAAKGGDLAALTYIIDHCKADVEVLAQTYARLKPFVAGHPSVPLIEGVTLPACPKCGSTHLHKRGSQVAKTRSYDRYQCQTCGAWSRGTHANGKVQIAA